ncbi:hypothetical protein CAP48_09440 [Advenella sp. S44]|uniref:cell division protein ZipA C-terminal FtsZ-binding domain-containing protein n=1 Tax=Advenella sp. S44 TaxID=1982755 RepID=UPI000C2B0D7C|nr:cell division protein ZipA C-terminal FtsZ-binding domain-containing protein [Advenella sp. S44]PJX26213.1 hypothetical protein CAP48_09440 [Advenella sp. S44]
MSNLQLALIAIGIVLILLVLLFNWWQDQRVRKQMHEQFSMGDEHENDVLLKDRRQVAPTQKAQADRRDPVFVDSEPDVSPETAVPAAADTTISAAQLDEHHDEEAVDEMTEGVIELHFATPVSGADLHRYTRTALSAGTKPLRFFAETEEGLHRADLRADEYYVSLQMAVLLANRGGALGEIEWSQAWAKADEIAHEFDASVESPDVPALLRRAEKLDQVCANLDTQVGLTVQLTQPHPVRSVIDVARAKGFTEYRNGLAWMNHDGLPRFVLLLAGEHAEDPANAGVNRVDLLLDVPCSPPDETPFARMMAVGRDLALSLDGQLIDDSGRPVMEGSEHAIDEQIRGIYEELEQQGLQAGSPRALRVFS